MAAAKSYIELEPPDVAETELDGELKHLNYVSLQGNIRDGHFSAPDSDVEVLRIEPIKEVAEKFVEHFF